MDQKDRNILKFLKENSRMPYTEIAFKLGMSEGAIRKRISKMEENGIIERYTVEVNPQKMGYNTIVLLGMDVEPKYFLKAARELSELECVKWVYTSTGDHAIMAEIWAEDTMDLENIISERISRIKGVSNLCPAILMDRIK